MIVLGIIFVKFLLIGNKIVPKTSNKIATINNKYEYVTALY